MIEWKRFEDEVPTEHRSLVVAENNGDGVWRMDLMHEDTEQTPAGRKFWDSGIGFSSVFVCHGAEGWEEFAEESAFTHWAYIDPPKVTP